MCIFGQPCQGSQYSQKPNGNNRENLKLIYLLQFSSYSVLDGVFEMPLLSGNNYITVLKRDLDEGNQLNVRPNVRPKKMLDDGNAYDGWMLTTMLTGYQVYLFLILNVYGSTIIIIHTVGIWTMYMSKIWFVKAWS